MESSCTHSITTISGGQLPRIGRKDPPRRRLMYMRRPFRTWWPSASAPQPYGSQKGRTDRNRHCPPWLWPQSTKSTACLGSSRSSTLGAWASRTVKRPSTRGGMRSEEHTSELQSRPHLVCRLLLEKKKTQLAETMTPTRRASDC